MANKTARKRAKKLFKSLTKKQRKNLPRATELFGSGRSGASARDARSIQNRLKTERALGVRRGS
jgi:hypothetical protein